MPSIGMGEIVRLLAASALKSLGRPSVRRHEGVVAYPSHRGSIRGLNADANVLLAEAGLPHPQNSMGNTQSIFNLYKRFAH